MTLHITAEAVKYFLNSPTYLIQTKQYSIYYENNHYGRLEPTTYWNPQQQIANTNVNQNIQK